MRSNGGFGRVFDRFCGRERAVVAGMPVREVIDRFLTQPGRCPPPGAGNDRRVLRQSQVSCVCQAGKSSDHRTRDSAPDIFIHSIVAARCFCASPSAVESCFPPVATPSCKQSLLEEYVIYAVCERGNKREDCCALFSFHCGARRPLFPLRLRIQPMPMLTLDEVVVTANRLGETAISRVPMSIVAQTQKSLDELGIKTSQDLQRIVPSLRVGFNGGNGPPISIRGIQGNNAATTGVYLDESPLQARTLGGLVTGGGTFLPLLFDLERIEVLKGRRAPSMVRRRKAAPFATSRPSPGSPSTRATHALSSTRSRTGTSAASWASRSAGRSSMTSLAFASASWGRRIGGWVDHVDWRTGQTGRQRHQLAGSEGVQERAALAATDNLSFTPSFYYAWDRKNDLDTIYNDVPQYTTPAIGTLLTNNARRARRARPTRRSRPLAR